MKDTILTFKRFEKKYLLSARKFDQLWDVMRDHMVPDRFFRSTVCSIYYDSDDYSLIRQSLERPIYKEKLRLRSYNVPGPDDPVFVELKKKFKGVVYKRRVEMSAETAEAYLAGQGRPPIEGQILHEIDFFLQANHVSPKVFIACDREAWDDRENPELRITFDRNLSFRDWAPDLNARADNIPLIAADQRLMEIKTNGIYPLWLTQLLRETGARRTHFSKYGLAYRQYIRPETKRQEGSSAECSTVFLSRGA
jgi:SPX domain-containing protein involved in vacuolar polyphosphate accumulation